METNLKPTPGPWFVHPGDSVVLINAENGDPVCATNTCSYYQKHSEQDKINAQLIAAAGTAASQLPEGVDPIAAVGALGEMVKLFELIKRNEVHEELSTHIEVSIDNAGGLLNLVDSLLSRIKTKESA